MDYSLTPSQAAAEGKRLADRVLDMNPLIDAIEDRFDEMEIFVPMWMEAAINKEMIDRLEKETGFKHAQIKRWQHMLKNREKFEAKIVNRIWRHWHPPGKGWRTE